MQRRQHTGGAKRIICGAKITRVVVVQPGRFVPSTFDEQPILSTIRCGDDDVTGHFYITGPDFHVLPGLSESGPVCRPFDAQKHADSARVRRGLRRVVGQTYEADANNEDARSKEHKCPQAGPRARHPGQPIPRRAKMRTHEIKHA
jgi:hypothetical protein